MSMESNTAEVLNDLIQINNDRIEGYRKALEQIRPTDTDLMNLFGGFITQSESLKSELQNEVSMLGETIEEGTTASGKIYRAWMDVKVAFTGEDRQVTLNNCEFGEDAAQKAYRSAEEADDILPDIKALITSQKMELKSSHDKVKLLRDNAKL